MNAVIDASFAYTVLDGTRLDARIREFDLLLAPDLIVAELLNVRWKLARSGVPVPTLDAIFGFVARTSLFATLAVAGAAAVLADQLDHPVYDCVYVALAQAERAKFLTVDSRLVRKMKTRKLGHLLA